MPIRGGGHDTSTSRVYHPASLRERSSLQEQNSTNEEWFETDQNSERGALLSTIGGQSGRTATSASTSRHAGPTNHYQLASSVEEETIDEKFVFSPPKPSEVERPHGDDLTALSVTEGGGGLDGVVSSPSQLLDFEILYNDEEDNDEKDLCGEGEDVVDDKVSPNKDENEGIDPDREGDYGGSPDTRLPVHDVVHGEDVDMTKLNCMRALVILHLILAGVLAAVLSTILAKSPAPTPRPTPSPTPHPTPRPFL